MQSSKILKVQHVRGKSKGKKEGGQHPPRLHTAGGRGLPSCDFSRKAHDLV